MFLSTDSTFPQCNGKCPPSDECTWNYLSRKCYCYPKPTPPPFPQQAFVRPPCHEADASRCQEEGVCPKGQTCKSFGDECICEPDSPPPSPSTLNP